VLTAILVDEGVTVDVGTVLAVIGDGSDETTSSAPEPVASSPRERPKEDATVHARANRSTSEESQLSPVVRRLLEENDLDVTTITGSGPNGRVTRQDVLAFIEQTKTAPVKESGPLSPIVRRLMSDSNIDPRLSWDRPSWRDHASRRRRIDRRVTAASIAGTARDEVIPFTKIRRLTAEHMVRSKATSAHTLMVKEVDYEQVELVRARLGGAFKSDKASV